MKATTLASELNLTLTGRDCGLKERVPMVGIPFHAVDNYVNKLIDSGYKVILAEDLDNVLEFNIMPPFTFDFTLKKPNMEYIPEQEHKISRSINGTGNFCPYPIPTVDEITKMIDRSAYKVNRSQLIADVFECGALAISNKVDFTQYDKREQQYLEIIKKYKPDEQKLIVDIFTKIFCLCSSVVCDNGRFNDYLGELFMKCNQGNKHAGQFFTPYHVSKLMAKMTITDDKITQDEILTVNDCCCGGGGLLLAALDVLKNYYIIDKNFFSVKL